MVRTTGTRFTEDTFEGLEAILNELVREHESLDGLATEHRAAIASLDAGRLKAAVTSTGDTLQRIARLEDQRALLLKLEPPAGGQPIKGQPTVAEVAELMDPPRRARVLDLAARLRELLESIRKRHRAIKRASQTLSSHMEGLAHQIAAELSGTGTYSRAGRVETGGTPIATGMDVRS
ncbi:MAG: hypothetical protein DHS20C14_01070 [Phycisphaeraceae bacterium]|nr:MAG: hypothetical protein DHS20C14_01070 [Phycisphaeraceae bacterium]